ncbi:MAG: choice-of-anchor H family protein [Pseudomonadota bacterium]
MPKWLPCFFLLITPICGWAADQPDAASSGRWLITDNLESPEMISRLNESPNVISVTPVEAADADYDGHYFAVSTRVVLQNLGHATKNVAVVKLYVTSNRRDETLIFISREIDLGSATENQIFEIVTTLNQAFPTDDYQVKAEVHALEDENDAESGAIEPIASIVSTVPLESRDLDRHTAHYHWIYSVDVHLSHDRDYDGHYSRIHTDVDADTDLASDWVYFHIRMRDSYGHWRVIATSGDFLIYGALASDHYSIDVLLGRGFPHDYFDLQVQLFESSTGYYLAGYGPTSRHSNLPLEGSALDSTVEVHAGSMNLWPIALFVFLTVRRRFKRK